jgi:hypothetical protein
MRRGKAASNSKNTGAVLGFEAQASVIARRLRVRSARSEGR